MKTRTDVLNALLLIIKNDELMNKLDRKFFEYTIKNFHSIHMSYTQGYFKGYNILSVLASHYKNDYTLENLFKDALIVKFNYYLTTIETLRLIVAIYENEILQGSYDNDYNNEEEN
jgi:hypothetical protein